MDKLTEGQKPYLSVFWYIDGVFHGSDDDLKGNSVENYGDYLNIGEDHYNIWPSYMVLLNTDVDYDFYPRGRIVFNTKIRKFKVVADPCIIDSKDIRDALLENYNLPITTIFEKDEHYSCSNCR